MKLTLKACRINVKATAKELGAAVGVTEDTIYKWENGKTSPKIFQVNRMIKYFIQKGFDVTIDDIIF